MQTHRYTNARRTIHTFQCTCKQIMICINVKEKSQIYLSISMWICRLVFVFLCIYLSITLHLFVNRCTFVPVFLRQTRVAAIDATRTHAPLYADFLWVSVARKNLGAFGVYVPLEGRGLSPWLDRCNFASDGSGSRWKSPSCVSRRVMLSTQTRGCQMIRRVWDVHNK